MGIWLNKDLTLRRKQLQGTSEKDEKLKLLCQIRHQFTNYDKLTIFYGVYPKKRSELNGIIHELIEKGESYIETFRKKVKNIEDSVNLNRKDTKKKYLAQEELRLKVANPLCKDSTIKQWALNNLNNTIRINNQRIQRTRSKTND